MHLHTITHIYTRTQIYARSHTSTHMNISRTLYDKIGENATSNSNTTPSDPSTAENAVNFNQNSALIVDAETFAKDYLKLEHNIDLSTVSEGEEVVQSHYEAEKQMQEYSAKLSSAGVDLTKIEPNSRTDPYQVYSLVLDALRASKIVDLSKDLDKQICTAVKANKAAKRLKLEVAARKRVVMRCDMDSMLEMISKENKVSMNKGSDFATSLELLEREEEVLQSRIQQLRSDLANFNKKKMKLLSRFSEKPPLSE